MNPNCGSHGTHSGKHTAKSSRMRRRNLRTRTDAKRKRSGRIVSTLVRRLIVLLQARRRDLEFSLNSSLNSPLNFFIKFAGASHYFPLQGFATVRISRLLIGFVYLFRSISIFLEMDQVCVIINLFFFFILRVQFVLSLLSFSF